MSQTAILLSAIICVIVIAIIYWLQPAETRNVTSGVDGRKYKVKTSYDAFDRAADLLASLNARISKLLKYFQNYITDDPQRQQAIARLLSKYNPNNLVENSPPKKPDGDTSYIINKGKVIAICLRDNKTGQLHDLDTLTFVVLHEMAHITVEETDHPPHFWSAFRFLLEEAENAQIYYSPKYAETPQNYCGMTINYNPRYDEWVAAL